MNGLCRSHTSLVAEPEVSVAVKAVLLNLWATTPLQTSVSKNIYILIHKTGQLVPSSDSSLHLVK